MFFESLAECSLGFTYVCVAAVDVTCDDIDGSILVFFRCYVFRAPTMNRDQGYHLPAIYNQIILPKSEATHVTPVREQDP